MNKKLSPAQQILVAAIAGKTLTYRIVSLWRGGVSTSSLVDVRIGGEKTEIKVRLATVEALADKGEVILTCDDHDNREYTVVLNHASVKAAAPEAEVPEAQEVTEAPLLQETPETAQPQKKKNIMAKKLSTAQQRAIEIIAQNPVVTDRRGCGGSVLIKYASRKYAPTGIKVATVEALIRLKLVTVHPADQDGDQAIKLVATEVEATEAPATPAPEAPEAPEATEADKIKYAIDNVKKQIDGNEGNLDQDSNDDERHYYLKKDCRLKEELIKLEAKLKTSTSEEAPQAAETITEVWPLKDMTKYGYAVVRVSENPNPAAGYVYYKVLDYKSASLVGLYDPATVCSHRTIGAAIAAAEEFEKIDIGTSRAWRACKIRMARLGLRKSKGVQTKTPTAPAPEATEAPDEAKAARAESLAKTEAATRHLIDTSEDDKLHRHNLGTILLMQGKKEEAKQVFLALHDSYRRDGKLEAAKQPLWEIILISGTHYSTCQIYIKLAQLCEELGQVEDAMTAYGLAAEVDGSVAESYYARARIFKSMGELEEAKAYLEHAQELADHREAPALSRETADAIEQRHNVIVDCASEMYTNDDPSHTNDYGAKGWKLIPQEWIDEVTHS